MSDFFRLNFGDSSEGSEAEFRDEDPSLALAIDDSLPIPDRIRKYINSEILLQRIYTIKSLKDYAKQLGFDQTKKHVISLLEELVTESEISIRQTLAEQIPKISEYLIGLAQDDAYTLVLHILVPMVAELTTDRNSQVRFAATESFFNLASQVKKDDIELYFFPIVRSLANDTTEEEHRLESTQLLANISPLMPQESAIRVTLPIATKLSGDASFKIRKSVASQFGNLCKAVGNDVTQNSLIPLFLKLSSDEIWGVRKVCAESLVSVCEVLDRPKRAEIILPLLDKLIEDQSRWVKGACYQNLGALIAQLPAADIPAKLIKYFTSMPTQGKAVGNQELVICCAYTLPAVLITVGPERWHEISPIYFTLVKDSQWKVRQTLAHSLHEVAKILGPSVAEASLLTVFDSFLRDLDEVKIGALKHMSEFLAMLNPHSRVKYLNVLGQVQQSKNWRVRKLLVKQLDTLSQLYSIQDNHNHILPLLLLSCHDSVAAIRNIAATKVGAMIRRMIRDDTPEYLEELMLQLLNLASHSAYARKQLYLHILSHEVAFFADHRDLFEQRFMKPLIKLSKDRVSNVRISLAQTLIVFRKYEEFHNQEWMVNLLEELRQDKSRDVIHFTNIASQTNIEPRPPVTEPTVIVPVISHDHHNNNNNNNTNENENSNNEATSSITPSEDKKLIDDHNNDDDSIEWKGAEDTKDVIFEETEKPLETTTTTATEIQDSVDETEEEEQQQQQSPTEEAESTHHETEFVTRDESEDPDAPKPDANNEPAGENNS